MKIEIAILPDLLPIWIFASMAIAVVVGFLFPELITLAGLVLVLSSLIPFFVGVYLIQRGSE